MKLAIICTGGGMRCAYSGGALVALAKRYHLTTPDIVIGLSGGAGSLAYYVSQQYDAIERIWTHLVATPKFISFRIRKPILDIDYLVDTVFKKESPLNLDAFSASPIHWYFSATDTDTKKQSRFFSKNDSVNIFELLRASMAVPFFYGKKVFLQKIGYQDGDLGLTIADAIKHASQLGATHIIVIESHAETFRVRLLDWLYKKFFLSGPKRSKNPDVLLSQNVLRIQNLHSPAGILTRNPAKLRATFDRGYADVLHHPHLREFLLPFQAATNPIQTKHV